MYFIKYKYLVYLSGLILFGLPKFSLSQVRKATPLVVLNSDADELMPVIAPDGKTIYFVRSNHVGNTGGKTAGQDIWFIYTSLYCI